MAKRNEKKIVNLPTDKIIVEDRQRTDMGNIDELAVSIAAKGLIQPITITPDYRLLAGGRRLAATKLAELPTIDCIIRPTEDKLDEREIELFENIHRKDLEWPEQAIATQQIHTLMQEKHGDEWTQRATAKLLGKSIGGINDSIQLAEAMAVLPALANLPTADAARKKVNRISKDAHIRRSISEAPAGSLSKFATDDYLVRDAVEGLSQASDRIASFAEVDPPYGIDLTEKRATRNKEYDTSIAIDTYHEIPGNVYPGFIKSVALQVYRILKDNTFCVWWYGPTWHCMVKDALESVGFHVDDIPAIWYKVDSPSTTNNPNVYLSRAYEPFFICRKGNPRIRNLARPNVFAFAGVPPSQRIHATERPVELMREILQTLAFPKYRILVPFLGSGNTLIAAYYESMSGWGYDLSQIHKDRFLARIDEQFPGGVEDDN